MNVLRGLDIRLISVGETDVTLSTLLFLLVGLLLLFRTARLLQRWLLLRLLARSSLDPGTQQVIGTLVRYLVLTFGVMAIVQTIGIDLTAFTLFAGALSVGVGFGLQAIFSNFVSGLIVMFERRFRPGDRIEVGGNEGEVVSINARVTVLRTATGMTVIVPNQKFITEYVRNWQAGEDVSILVMPLRVARSQDPGLAQRALLETVAADPGVLDTPAPVALLVALDAGATQVELQCWVRGGALQRAEIRSRLLAALRVKVDELGVELV